MGLRSFLFGNDEESNEKHRAYQLHTTIQAATKKARDNYRAMQTVEAYQEKLANGEYEPVADKLGLLPVTTKLDEGIALDQTDISRLTAALEKNETRHTRRIEDALATVDEALEEAETVLEAEDEPRTVQRVEDAKIDARHQLREPWSEYGDQLETPHLDALYEEEVQDQVDQ